MPKPQKRLTHQEKVVNAVGKRPKGRDQIAEKMGVSPQSIARALGTATAQGQIVKTEKGYQRSLK